MDGLFGRTHALYEIEADRASLRRLWADRLGLSLDCGAERRFWFPVFSYARNYERIIADLAVFHRAQALQVFAAAGPSQACLLDAWEKAERPFPMVRLPFLRQEDWDELLIASDFSIIRGEESLSRAALAGKPFLWHAYALEGAHQLVKVQALLDCLKQFFSPDEFIEFVTLSLSFNDREQDGNTVKGPESLLPVLKKAGSLQLFFKLFAQDLWKRGDLAFHLLTFMRDLG